MYQFVLIATGPLNRKPSKFTPSSTEGSLGSGNEFRYGTMTPVLTPIPSGSMALIWDGLTPKLPAAIVWGSESLNRPAAALCWIRALIRNHTVAHCRAGDNAHHALRLPLPATLIVRKEEQAILLDGAADRAAENIANQLRRFVGLSTAQLGKLHEIVVGAGERVAVNLKERPVKIVRATLGYQRNLRARRAALIRVVVGRGNPELLHGIHSNWQHRLKCVAFGVGVDINAVESDVALIASRAVNRATPGIGVEIDICTIPGIRDACLQRKQVRDVATFQWKRFHLSLAEGYAE